MYNSVAVSTFTMLCSHHHCPPPELVHYPELKLCTLFPLPPPVLVTSVLLLISMNLPILSTSYKQMSNTMFVFLCLAYFTEDKIFRAHPCCSRCQDLVPFYGSIVCKYYILFACLFADEHLTEIFYTVLN